MRFEKTFVAAVFAAVLVAAGSATMLDSYGVITGTADVEAAVSMTVDAGSDQVTLAKKTASEITSEDSMQVYNATDGSSEEILANDVEMTGPEGETKTIGVDLSNVESVGLKIDGTVLEKVNVG